jgi:hypothetical protein
MKQVSEDNDRLYYNVNIVNNTLQPIAAFHDKTENSPIVNNPSNWLISVERFNIPGDKIPIFLFKDNTYSIHLEYAGSVAHQVVAQTQHNFTDSSDKSVYTYSSFIVDINNAIALCYEDLRVLQPSLPLAFSGTGNVWFPPIITFDSSTQLFSFAIPYDVTVGPTTFSYITNTALTPNPIKIYMNTQLFQFFRSWNYNFFGYNNNSGIDYQIIFNNQTLTSQTISTPNYGNLGLFLAQDYAALWAWLDIQSIVITTSSIPITPEFVPNIVGQNRGQTSSKVILTDFIPQVDNQLLSNFFFQYNAITRRLMNLQSTQPMYRVDIQLFWQDKDQNLYPIYIPPGGHMTMKLMFIKKTSLSVN